MAIEFRNVFLLTPPGGGDRGGLCDEGDKKNFYSRPRAGAIKAHGCGRVLPRNFYSRPRAGAIGNLPQNRYHVPRQTAERSLAFLWDPPRMIAKLPPKPRKAPESTALTFHEIMVGKGRR